MSSDVSRQRFDPANNFSGVQMQQGRVQLDADWNEWHDILDRRWRAETIDIIGRGVVPRETPDGFAITVSGGMLRIGRGRIYVDGLQAENHGAGARAFDNVLAESRGVDALRYDQQPYLPKVPPLPQGGGPHLVYLDVWQREVTAMEDPRLVESAVGVDTTTRVQTVWQVRVLPRVGSSAACNTPDEDLPGWLDLTRPSAGRLTTAATGVAQPDDPCLIPPTGGYRGLENRTYRVEIHDGGAVGAATFKWSRDNASLAASVTKIEGGDTLTVDRAVWDSVRRFSAGDWIEITDDWRELSGLPGEIRRIASVVDATRTIALEAPLTAGEFPVNGQNATEPARHTRIKRWDQAGLVHDAGGATFFDLDAAGGSGVIPVPAAGTSLLLEDGVQVTFSVDPAGGAFRPGDYWIFVARTADASVEILDAAPPRGVHHHYCRLAMVTLPDAVVDCRKFWPPSFEAGESCDCTVCVTADQHNQGSFTIHQAVDQIRVTGGTICLGPGVFNLQQQPVRLDRAFGVRIRGQGAATIVIQPRGDAAFIFRNSQWCTVDYLTTHTIAGATAAPAIRLMNSIGSTIERLIISAPGEGPGPLAGVLLEPGFLLLTKIRENSIRAQAGVSFRRTDNQNAALFLVGFSCERNFLQCRERAVDLGAGTFYAGETRLARNLIFGTTIAGIAVTGAAVPELEVSGNAILPMAGDGIITAGAGVRISGNRILHLSERAQHGVRLVRTASPISAAPASITDNRFDSIRGDAVVVETLVAAANIARNVFYRVDGDGVTMREGSAAFSLSVNDNQFLDVAGGSERETRARELAAIYLQNVFEGAVCDNAITGVGVRANLAAVIAGVRVDNCLDLRVSDNSIANLAPRSNFKVPVAFSVLVIGPLVHAQVSQNMIRRQLVMTDPDDSPWQAIRVVGLGGQSPGKKQFAGFANLTPAAQLNVLGVFASASAARREEAGVLGNAIDGFGRNPLAEVLVRGTCRFSDNHCTANELRSRAVVLLTADCIISSSNRIECLRDQHALELNTANKNRVTVLGNIVGGQITENGPALGAPWQPLNLFGV